MRRIFTVRFGGHRMNQRLQLNPPQILVLGFLSTILIGSLLLYLPFTHEPGIELNYIEALFTATSAVTVTGLNVIDPGTTFNLFGELIIMLLIQVGGLGFMSFAITIFVLLGKKIGLKQRLLMQEGSNQIHMAGIVNLALHLLRITLLFELIGSIFLTYSWHERLGWAKAAYYGAFHAVSAFNNAGFSLFATGLVEDVNHPIVNLVVATLIILGGLGFVVLLEVWNKKFHVRKLSLHSKVTLTVSLFLILLGTLLIFLLEFGNPHSLAQLPFGTKVMASFFQSVVTRTAGFNTLDIGSLKQATLFIMTLFMFIGAAPGSTGGGIKITTITILLSTAKSLLLGKQDVILFERRLPIDHIFRALTIIILALGIVIVMTLVLDITEHGVPFLTILFEVVSAFGTVGLSMGLTPNLTTIGRFIIMLTMFIGKLGPLTIGYALAKRSGKEYFKYPEEKMMIG